jgi:hypothetical protein
VKIQVYTMMHGQKTIKLRLKMLPNYKFYLLSAYVSPSKQFYWFLLEFYVKTMPGSSYASYNQ